MAKAKWVYHGDRNIENGGMFFKDEGDEDFILVVDVTPASDGGGPDNLFLVEVGSVFMPTALEKVRAAASVCGYEIADDKSMSDHSGDTFEFQSPEWRMRMLDAWKAYHGVERDSTWIVRVGKPDKYARPGSFLANMEPDFILRSNVNLAKFIKGEFCQ